MYDTASRRKFGFPSKYKSVLGASFSCLTFFASKEVLGDLPQKTFTDVSVPMKSSPLEIPPPPKQQQDDAAENAGGDGKGQGNPAAMAALDRVLRLLQVGSKRFLTNKAS